MSFSSDVKTEILSTGARRGCCKLAYVTGIVYYGAALNIGGTVSLCVGFTQSKAAEQLISLLRSEFGFDSALERSESGGRERFRVIISGAENVTKLLYEVGVDLAAGISPGMDKFDEIIKSPCCKKAFLRGAFLVAGAITHPEKDYHVDFTYRLEEFGIPILNILENFTLSPKISRRGSDSVIYIKGADAIADLLTLMGAHGAKLAFEDSRMVRSIRGGVNRWANCELANMDKTLAAASRQLEAIERLESVGAIERLDETLLAVAELRKANPGASLNELSDLSGLSRSGVNYRLKQLEQM